MAINISFLSNCISIKCHVKNFVHFPLSERERERSTLTHMKICRHIAAWLVSVSELCLNKLIKVFGIFLVFFFFDMIRWNFKQFHSLYFYFFNLEYFVQFTRFHPNSLKDFVSFFLLPNRKSLCFGKGKKIVWYFCYPNLFTPQKKYMSKRMRENSNGN